MRCSFAYLRDGGQRFLLLKYSEQACVKHRAGKTIKLTEGKKNTLLHCVLENQDCGEYLNIAGLVLGTGVFSEPLKKSSLSMFQIPCKRDSCETTLS